MKKKFPMEVEESLYKKIKRKSKALKLSMNRYVTMAIEKDLGINNLVDIDVKVKE